MSDLTDDAYGIAGELDNNLNYPQSLEQRIKISSTLIKLAQENERLNDQLKNARSVVYDIVKKPLNERTRRMILELYRDTI